MSDLKEYLNAINQSKENLMEDPHYEKKYPAWVVNHALYSHSDMIFLVCFHGIMELPSWLS